MCKDDPDARSGPGRPGLARISGRRTATKWVGGRILYLCGDLGVATNEVVPMLRSAGYRVQAVQIDEFNLQGWRQAGWLLVLLDFNDPDGTCFRLCARLRAFTGTPIMAVLRGKATHDVSRVFRAGADAIMPVSATKREFLARVEALLRRRQLDGLLR